MPDENDNEHGRKEGRTTTVPPKKTAVKPRADVSPPQDKVQEVGSRMIELLNKPGHEGAKEMVRSALLKEKPITLEDLDGNARLVLETGLRIELAKELSGKEADLAKRENALATRLAELEQKEEAARQKEADLQSRENGFLTDKKKAEEELAAREATVKGAMDNVQGIVQQRYEEAVKALEGREEDVSKKERDLRTNEESSQAAIKAEWANIRAKQKELEAKEDKLEQDKAAQEDKLEKSKAAFAAEQDKLHADQDELRKQLLGLTQEKQGLAADRRNLARRETLINAARLQVGDMTGLLTEANDRLAATVKEALAEADKGAAAKSVVPKPPASNEVVIDDEGNETPRDVEAAEEIGTEAAEEGEEREEKDEQTPPNGQ